MSETTHDALPALVIEGAARLRPQYEAILAELRRADEILQDVMPLWEATNIDLLALENETDWAALDRLGELSGYRDVWSCAAWIYSRVSGTVGGEPALPIDADPGQREAPVQVP